MIKYYPYFLYGAPKIEKLEVKKLENESVYFTWHEHTWDKRIDKWYYEHELFDTFSNAVEHLRKKIEQNYLDQLKILGSLNEPK